MRKKFELPHVVEMEKAVLAAMLLKNGEVIPTVTAILQEEDFYRAEHRVIFRSISSFLKKKIDPNFLSLVEDLRASGDLEKIGTSYVLELADASYSTAYAETYALKIKEKSILRNLIEAGDSISEEAVQDRKPIEEILDDAERKIFSITSRREISEFEKIDSILMRTYEKISRAYNHPGEYSGVKTFYYDLDKVTSGLQRSDLILLAARPSMGKTAFALNIALNAAKNNTIVAIFSLEMSKEQIGSRLLSLTAQIDSQRMNTGDLDEQNMKELTDAMESIADTKIFIDDTPSISIMELRSKARRLQHEHGLDLIIIDYLQLMQGSGGRNVESRQQEISEISRSLKALARELRVPVVALSQLSRSVELRAEKKPQLSDLRESGSLEQDADLVMFLYREEYYNRQTDNKNTAELIIAKNRNGPTTTIDLEFKKECMKFNSMAYEH